MAVSATAEFDRQVSTLVDKGYPAAAGISAVAFRRALAPLRRCAARLPAPEVDLNAGRLSMVLVITSGWVSTEEAMARVERAGRRGQVAMHPVSPTDFSVRPDVRIPKGRAYLLLQIDRGRDSLNVRPEDALKMIRRRRRSPLTMDEGVALVTQFSDFLRKNNCFSLLASRRADQRVPALWISGEQRPKLGWCWDRNPHSWLGSASCRRRIAAPRSNASTEERASGSSPLRHKA
jgi:hypothetical protein